MNTPGDDSSTRPPTAADGMSAPVLELSNLRTHIQGRNRLVQAVDGVSLHINAGETVGLVGESGCGKTLTGLSILRLLPTGGRIVGGSIRLGGRELVGLPENTMRHVRGNEVAMIFQDPMTSLNPTMTVGNQIAEAVLLHRDVSRTTAIERATEVLDLVGVPRPRERLHDYPHQLSGGLRQRVMIAMALACDPKALIADEPTTALDVTIQAQILALLDRLKEQLHMGVLLITHDMGVIAGHAERVMVMYAGRIVDEAPAGELLRNVRHPYTEALLEAIPRPGQDVSQRLYSIPGQPPDLSAPPPFCRFAPRCRHARPDCLEADPQLGSDGSDHWYACFHPVGIESRPHAGSRVAEGGPTRLQKVPAGSEHTDDQSPMLRLDRVVKEYPIARGWLRKARTDLKAVSDVSFSIMRGETFGLVGESGCGKSTLARLAVGLESPTAGTITFDGGFLSDLIHPDWRQRAHARRRRRDLQLIFQDPYSSLDPRMTIGAILREPLVVQRIGSRAEQNTHVASLLDEVGLPSRVVHLYPHEFSGGQRQRFGLARALALEPKMLIADEPTSALDVSVRSQILNLMREIQHRHGLTYLIISHDLAVIRYMADRTGVMYLGKLVEIGPSAAVYQSAVHPYTAGLLESIPDPDPRKAHTRGAIPVRGELPSAIDPPSGCRYRTRCPRAQDMCAAVEPPLVRFGPNHYAACHFPLRPPAFSDLEEGGALMHGTARDDGAR
jgi:peptide/nickel transport system ATP-binding protein